jgi:YbbR domain-containing protein
MITFLRNLIARDFLLKVFSLALAVLIWLTLSLQREGGPPATGLPLPERTFEDLPVMVTFRAQDMRAFKIRPTVVQVTVRADARLLDKLPSQELRPIVDLSGVEPGSVLRKRIEVLPPPGVTVVSVEPMDVEVDVPAKAKAAN